MATAASNSSRRRSGIGRIRSSARASLRRRRSAGRELARGHGRHSDGDSDRGRPAPGRGAGSGQGMHGPREPLEIRLVVVDLQRQAHPERIGARDHRRPRSHARASSASRRRCAAPSSAEPRRAGNGTVDHAADHRLGRDPLAFPAAWPARRAPCQASAWLCSRIASTPSTSCMKSTPGRRGQPGRGIARARASRIPAASRRR